MEQYTKAVILELSDLIRIKSKYILKQDITFLGKKKKSNTFIFKRNAYFSLYFINYFCNNFINYFMNNVLGVIFI